MTPDEIRAMITQLGLTQAGLATALNAMDPLMRATQATVSRWLMDRGNPNARTPDIRSTDALTRLWLHEGYPVTVTMRDGTKRSGALTTDNPASSYGQPVVVIDGTAYGSGDVASISLDDAPASISQRARDAGYATA